METSLNNEFENSGLILTDLLKNNFGFKEFRPYQIDVCRCAYEGSDVLLVMPTGAGKSLCYQLPGFARKGCTLVISPLLALIEDQVSHLQSKGFRAERIHSGRDRADSRKVCELFIEGQIDFLFISPERLAVPGFLDFLSKGELSLIAIDEAHCISQWGHDFRPEYRMLGERLSQLTRGGSTPVIALTATATPLVQKDIVSQLKLKDAKMFIQGFRRTNIAISVEESGQSTRSSVIEKLIETPESRPAIIYTSTRKNAEALKSELRNKFRVSLYHAGLSKDQREKAQNDFMFSKTDVIVATVAFGMGIDKANVRTVIHQALPSSLEAYYQEIGRAGRDGEMSKAVLLWSYADLKLQEFLLSKNYPELETLQKIYKAVAKESQIKDALGSKLRGIDSDLYESALEKLWIHKAVEISADEIISIGPNKHWEAAYIKQRQHRASQSKDMEHFAKSDSCRMLSLVKHFGDAVDNGAPCGICDICKPDTADMRPLNSHETLIFEKMYQLFKERDAQATGKVHRDEFPQLDRKIYEMYLSLLSKASLLYFENRVFQKGSETIPYRVVFAVEHPHYRDIISKIMIRDLPASTKAPKTKKTSGKKTIIRKLSIEQSADPAVELRIERLKTWRIHLARAKAVPAFTILSDKTLRMIAIENPKTSDALLAIHGMGPKLLEKHGKEILKQLI